MSEVVYDWAQSGRTSDWKLEGNGQVLLAEPDGVMVDDTDRGALQLRTFHCGPGRRATTVWLKDLILPPNFRIEWTHRSKAADGNTMLIFNALPLGLADFFEDPRPDARYCDLGSYGKIICHTLGFHRGVYGRPSVLRKLGGHVPPHWGQMNWVGPYQEAYERETTLSSQTEPLTAADRGRPHNYAVQREGTRIQAWIDGQLLHDITDHGQYPHFKESLTGGRIAFRNFSGYADDFYPKVRVEKL
ncbi:MAG TPA: hypothetical protein VL860_06885 [Planctomycetota bacterium]|nr:hypothetical protein [Planctomycetota bacterium]